MREESPLGLLLVRESKVDALAGNWRGTKRDFITASAIPLDNPITEESPSYLRVRLQNCDLEGFNLTSERQELHGDTLEITREDLLQVPGCAIPIGGKEMQEYLSPTPFIQSADPTLRRQAAEIIGDEHDALRAAMLIQQWVYRTIEKKPTLSIPSALDVLKLKVGDCNEHAVLFTALCRAAGIPSRFCAGLVYNQGSFYYHAWSEVFAGRWVSVDPALDQLPADATHIRLVEGGLDRQLEIVRLIGVLKVEVIEYR
jgi:transglutaminase-like putative cysteine protease